MNHAMNSIFPFLVAVFTPTTHLHNFWLTFLSASSLMVGVVTHTITRQFKDASNTSYTKTEAITGNVEHNFDQLVPIAANNHYVWSLIRADAQSIEITTDVAVTIYTNAASGGSPADTIPLAAGAVMVWTKATDTLTAGPGLVKCPFSVDITDLYITNAAASAANVRIRTTNNQ